MPSKAPEAQRLLEKPDMNTYCPASGKKLRLKDLIPIRFARCAEDEEGYAKDPVTRDTFTNANRLVVLKSTGTAPEALAVTHKRMGLFLACGMNETFHIMHPLAPNILFGQAVLSHSMPLQGMSCCTRHTPAASSRMASMRGRPSKPAMSLSCKEAEQVC